MKIRIITTCLFLSAVSELTFAQGTAFTYQGRLNDGANPANGSYDLRFAIYNSVNAGGLIAGPLTNSATGVTNGLFTVTLDFGGIFTGTNYWLDIGARTNGAGAFTGLTPRQPLTPTPYAIFANTAGNVSGTIPNGALPPSPNFSGTVTATAFSGNGTNLTSLNADNISSGTLADARLSANVALRAGGNTFTEAQVFNGPIYLNTTNGFDQSSVGSFLIDAPFLPGGRIAVLENGNVGIGNPSPAYRLDVGGDVGLPLPATIYAAGNPILRVDVNGNLFAGNFAGNVALSGGANVGIGYGSLYFDTLGFYNTAVGYGALNLNTNGGYNTAIGAYALVSNTSGNTNTAIGYQALYSNTSGSNNTANGALTLYANTSGSVNTANGYQALYSNTTGGSDVANGDGALYSNTTGVGNVGDGENTLYANIDGYFNTAIGHWALAGNTSGSENIALGHIAGYNITTGTNNIDIGNQGFSTDTNIIRIGNGQAATFIVGSLNLSSNLATILSGGNLLLRAEANNENFFGGPTAGNLTMSGIRNTGLGFGALHSNTSGVGNTAAGDGALYFNTGGTENTADGFNALLRNNANANTATGYYALGDTTTGGANTADGDSALTLNIVGFGNTASGYHALSSNTNGSYNIALGYQAGLNLTSTTSNIDIGNSGVSGDAGTIRIGAAQARTFIAGISGATAASGVQVFVNSSGQLGTLTSSERFKQNIRSMGDTSDVLLALRPVAFQYKPDLDPEGLPQFGLIAEEVDKVAPDLVARDDKNQIYTVRYQAVDAMLLNEFLKQHRTVQAQNSEIQDLKQQNESLEKRLENLEQMVKSLIAKD